MSSFPPYTGWNPPLLSNCFIYIWVALNRFLPKCRCSTWFAATIKCGSTSFLGSSLITRTLVPLSLNTSWNAIILQATKVGSSASLCLNFPRSLFPTIIITYLYWHASSTSLTFRSIALRPLTPSTTTGNCLRKRSQNISFLRWFMLESPMIRIASFFGVIL